MSVICPACVRLGYWCPEHTLSMTAIKPTPPAPRPATRYGIIPCRRCAFFESRFKLCMRHPPTIGSDGDALFPEVVGFVMDPTGCGDGLLREEAAPLPPEQQEPKP